MISPPSWSRRVAALFGFLAVALGALGAHALQTHFVRDPRAVGWWDKAASYHLVHAVVLFVLSGGGDAGRRAPAVPGLPEGPWWLFAAGIVLFSGSLYALALTGLPWLGAVTPFGGLCFLAGWLWIALRPPTR